MSLEIEREFNDDNVFHGNLRELLMYSFICVIYIKLQNHHHKQCSNFGMLSFSRYAFAKCIVLLLLLPACGTKHANYWILRFRDLWTDDLHLELNINIYRRNENRKQSIFNLEKDELSEEKETDSINTSQYEHP